jgi:hypothetical protein
MKEASMRARQNKVTTWISDPLAPDLQATGPGVGVIEFTLINSINTNISRKPGTRGSCTVSLADPYKLSIITESDIDRAVKEAYLEDGGLPSFSTERSKQIIAETNVLDAELNASRRGRNVSEINFNFPFGTATDVQAVLVRLNKPFTESDVAASDRNLRRAFQEPDRPVSFGDIPESESFTTTESVRCRQIFQLLREYKSIQDRALDQFQLLNNLNDDIRDRLRQERLARGRSPATQPTPW